MIKDITGVEKEEEVVFGNESERMVK